MQNFSESRFTGERALFQTNGAKIHSCIFADGESPLKESCDLDITNTTFQWKYPLWYCKNVKVTNCSMLEMARAGVWYTDNITMTDVLYGAPKGFRRCHNVTLTNVSIPDAQETLWHCQNVTLTNVNAHGNYFALDSSDMVIENLSLFGNYCFDGAKNITIRNSKLMSKDAFWNAENITVENCNICGEYLGWNSKNITFINCTIESEQGLCYMDNVVLKNCKLLNTNLAFEYASNIDAEITSSVLSVKNPISGKITAKGIEELIFDNDDMDAKNTVITTSN